MSVLGAFNDQQDPENNAILMESQSTAYRESLLNVSYMEGQPFGLGWLNGKNFAYAKL